MARNLKKFVNLSFLKTIDLELMRHLLERHKAHLSGLDLAIFDQKPSEVRKALQNFFAGPEEGYPKGLTADLHRIAELANQTGLRLLLERAAAAKVELIPKTETEGEGHHLNPKHVALRAFLDQPAVFNAASDFAELGHGRSPSLRRAPLLSYDREPRRPEPRGAGREIGGATRRTRPR